MPQPQLKPAWADGIGGCGSLTDPHFRALAQLIETQVGIKIPPGKRFMLEGRLLKRVRALGLTDIRDYVDALFEPSQFEHELIHLIDAVTTNKTDFFREPAHFDFLRQTAVPELLNSRGGALRSGALKVWSAAASMGMEAYTIAIVLDDMVRSGPRFDFRILGTDISNPVLRIAETGIYSTQALTPVPENLVKRYFLRSRNPARDECRVVPELRRRVNFQRMNLMDSTYPVDRDVDIIFCRNVLIYFDKPTQRQVVTRLCSHLRPGGYLMVGHSESMVHSVVPGLKQVRPTIFTV
ncbi:chemotaxis protein methyltransferase [Bradyrhizobium sp. SSBR45G]|uniref:CheR family methyltransferase n=1 Tax=unclassified Bradyrhizobium TaxID=2631580 RepID=UPI0023429B13|nr:MULTISPECIES: CheR family methyltransferase [unclassified Bradyrhizobium]GLH81952.1 chemotaxis protein methyltransferase [Bradyrhizobium sp. SSBR45G]GLH89445.1 chemotaxis protein methyltransferase [Bradyrhizobium sp. SSBR45R]